MKLVVEFVFTVFTLFVMLSPHPALADTAKIEKKHFEALLIKPLLTLRKLDIKGFQVPDVNGAYSKLNKQAQNFLNSTAHQAKLALGYKIVAITLDNKWYRDKGQIIVKLDYSDGSYNFLYLGGKYLIEF